MGLVEEQQKEELGVWIYDTWCGILLYADDIVMIAEDGEPLQRVLVVAGDYEKRWKFWHNKEKVK